ncbi:hypothetical protein B0J17DRAFT_674965 [Rhizoctonia solani]|nr:hypothetical protein B0J17DRAFT_674965 [Rhizoctonia solani]
MTFTISSIFFSLQIFLTCQSPAIFLHKLNLKRSFIIRVFCPSSPVTEAIALRYVLRLGLASESPTEAVASKIA